MNKLPPELVRHILRLAAFPFEEKSTYETLRSACLVSKAIFPIAQELLFSYVYIWEPDPYDDGTGRHLEDSDDPDVIALLERVEREGHDNGRKRAERLIASEAFNRYKLETVEFGVGNGRFDIAAFWLDRVKLGRGPRKVIINSIFIIPTGIDYWQLLSLPFSADLQELETDAGTPWRLEPKAQEQEPPQTIRRIISHGGLDGPAWAATVPRCLPTIELVSRQPLPMLSLEGMERANQIEDQIPIARITSLELKAVERGMEEDIAHSYVMWSRLLPRARLLQRLDIVLPSYHIDIFLTAPSPYERKLARWFARSKLQSVKISIHAGRLRVKEANLLVSGSLDRLLRHAPDNLKQVTLCWLRSYHPEDSSRTEEEWLREICEREINARRRDFESRQIELRFTLEVDGH